MKPKKGDSNSEMDEQLKDPLQLIKELVLLIVEARTPDFSVKGRVEGPHCPVIRGRPAHKCHAEKPECIRAGEFCYQAQRLWMNGIPICLDIVLFPDCNHGRQEALVTEGTVARVNKENVLLVERWTIDSSKRRQEDGLSSNMLLQAVRSYLHFSQVSSWLYSSAGRLPGYLAYRVYAPGEERTLDFSVGPDNHKFPVTLASYHHIRVAVSSLQRQPSVPVLLCNQAQEEAARNLVWVKNFKDDRDEDFSRKSSGQKRQEKGRDADTATDSFKFMAKSAVSGGMAGAAGVEESVRRRNVIGGEAQAVKSLKEQVTEQVLCGGGSYVYKASLAHTYAEGSLSPPLRAGGVSSVSGETEKRHTLSQADISAKKARNLARMNIGDGGEGLVKSGDVYCATRTYAPPDLSYEVDDDCVTPQRYLVQRHGGEPCADVKRADTVGQGARMKTYERNVHEAAYGLKPSQQDVIKRNRQVTEDDVQTDDRHHTGSGRRISSRVKKKDGEKDQRIEQMKKKYVHEEKTIEKDVSNGQEKQLQCGRLEGEGDIQALIRQKKKAEYSKVKGSLNVDLDADLGMWQAVGGARTKKLSVDPELEAESAKQRLSSSPSSPKHKLLQSKSYDSRNQAMTYARHDPDSKTVNRKKSNISQIEANEEEFIRKLSDRLSLVTTPSEEPSSSPKLSPKAKTLDSQKDMSLVSKFFTTAKPVSPPSKKFPYPQDFSQNSTTFNASSSDDKVIAPSSAALIYDPSLSQLTIEVSKSPDLFEDSDNTPVASPNQTPRVKSVSESLVKSVAEKSIKQNLVRYEKEWDQFATTDNFASKQSLKSSESVRNNSVHEGNLESNENNSEVGWSRKYPMGYQNLSSQGSQSENGLFPINLSCDMSKYAVGNIYQLKPSIGDPHDQASQSQRAQGKTFIQTGEGISQQPDKNGYWSNGVAVDKQCVTELNGQGSADTENFQNENGFVQKSNSTSGEFDHTEKEKITRDGRNSPRSRRMFQENLLPLVSYDADSDSFRQVEQSYNAHILHSPKVLFSYDVPSTALAESRKCIDFGETLESEFFRTKLGDMVDSETIGNYMSNLAALSRTSSGDSESKDMDDGGKTELLEFSRASDLQVKSSKESSRSAKDGGYQNKGGFSSRVETVIDGKHVKEGVIFPLDDCDESLSCDRNKSTELKVETWRSVNEKSQGGMACDAQVQGIGRKVNAFQSRNSDKTVIDRNQPQASTDTNMSRQTRRQLEYKEKEEKIAQKVDASFASDYSTTISKSAEPKQETSLSGNEQSSVTQRTQARSKEIEVVSKKKMASPASPTLSSSLSSSSSSSTSSSSSSVCMVPFFTLPTSPIAPMTDVEPLLDKEIDHLRKVNAGQTANDKSSKPLGMKTEITAATAPALSHTNNADFTTTKYSEADCDGYAPQNIKADASPNNDTDSYKDGTAEWLSSNIVLNMEKINHDFTQSFPHVSHYLGIKKNQVHEDTFMNEADEELALPICEHYPRVKAGKKKSAQPHVSTFQENPVTSESIEPCINMEDTFPELATTSSTSPTSESLKTSSAAFSAYSPLFSTSSSESMSSSSTSATSSSPTSAKSSASILPTISPPSSQSVPPKTAASINLCHNDVNSPTSLSKVTLPRPSPQDELDLTFQSGSHTGSKTMDASQDSSSTNSDFTYKNEVQSSVLGKNLLSKNLDRSHVLQQTCESQPKAMGHFVIHSQNHETDGTSHTICNTDLTASAENIQTIQEKSVFPVPEIVSPGTNTTAHAEKSKPKGSQPLASSQANSDSSQVNSTQKTANFAQPQATSSLSSKCDNTESQSDTLDCFKSPTISSCELKTNMTIQATIPLPFHDRTTVSSSTDEIKVAISQADGEAGRGAASKASSVTSRLPSGKKSSKQNVAYEGIEAQNGHFEKPTEIAPENEVVGHSDTSDLGTSQEGEKLQKNFHKIKDHSPYANYTTDSNRMQTESDYNLRNSSREYSAQLGDGGATQNGDTMHHGFSSAKIIQTRLDSRNGFDVEEEDNDDDGAVRDNTAEDGDSDVVFYISELKEEKSDLKKSLLSASLGDVAPPVRTSPAIRPSSLSAEVDLEMRSRTELGRKVKDGHLDTGSHPGSPPFHSDPPGWTSTPPHRTVSTPSCMDREVKDEGRRSTKASVIQQQYCDTMGPGSLRRMAVRSASMIFNSRTGLPTQSSPAPLKRKPGGKFDYDSELLNTRAIKNAFSCSRLTSNMSDKNDIIEEEKKRTLSTSAPASTNCLLGNFEESILNGRIDPVGTVDGFTAEIGASGSFCPKHLYLPVSAFFFALSDDNAPSPYLGHINLECVNKKGYHIPKKGTVQVTLFNPNKTVVKMFVVMYDLSDMPPSSQTFIRQRTIYCPTDKTSTSPSYLRYLIHLRCASSRSGKIYLHTDIRLIFARHKPDIDAKTVPYELKSFTEGPRNPKYSPKK